MKPLKMKAISPLNIQDLPLLCRLFCKLLRELQKYHYKKVS